MFRTIEEVRTEFEADALLMASQNNLAPPPGKSSGAMEKPAPLEKESSTARRVSEVVGVDGRIDAWIDG